VRKIIRNMVADETGIPARRQGRNPVAGR
jgi:hypothetical protein